VRRARRERWAKEERVDISFRSVQLDGRGERRCGGSRKVGKGRMGEVSGGGIKSERKRGRGLF